MLGFFELPDDERPPEEMWHHAERVSEWFEAVSERRKNPGMEPVDNFDVPVMQNEYLAEVMGD